MSEEIMKKVVEEVKEMRKKFLKEEQERTDEHWAEDGCKLKDDTELNGMIADFGFGETDFHTADIWRLIKELMYWQTKYRLLRIKKEESKTTTNQIKECFETEFHGIDCIENDDEFGFEGCYNNDLNHPDPRPGHRIWLKKLHAEKLYGLFGSCYSEESKE